MTLFDLEELTGYWADHPPLHIRVAAYLGVGKHRRQGKPSMPASQRPAADPDLTALLAELGPGFGASDVHTGLAPVVSYGAGPEPTIERDHDGKQRECGNPRVLLPLRNQYAGH